MGGNYEYVDRRLGRGVLGDPVREVVPNTAATEKNIVQLNKRATGPTAVVDRKTALFHERVTK